MCVGGWWEGQKEDEEKEEGWVGMGARGVGGGKSREWMCEAEEGGEGILD